MVTSLRKGVVWPNAESADTVEQVPEGQVSGWISDGTDEYTNGDVVIVMDWNGTDTAAVVGNVDTGNGLVSVDTTVSGDLGGLL